MGSSLVHFVQRSIISYTSFFLDLWFCDRLSAVFSGEYVALNLVLVCLVDQHGLQDCSKILVLILHLTLLLCLHV